MIEEALVKEEIEKSDQSVRDRALRVTESFIVEAPAGSGKTALLTQRFLALLAIVEKKPEECLAITFTRKAAAEMKDRILEALERALEDTPPEEPHEYKTWALARKVIERDRVDGFNLIQNPNRLKIQTIDALCASILKQMPLMSRFGASPNVVENPEKSYETAAENVLVALESSDSEIWSSHVRRLLEHLDNNLFLAKRLLMEMLPHREQWLPYLGSGLPITRFRELLENGLKCAVQDTLEHLEEVKSEEMDNILELKRFADEQLGKTLNFEYYNSLDSVENKENLNENLVFWKEIAGFLLTEEGEFRKTVTMKQGFPAPSESKDKSEKALYQTMKTRMKEVLGLLEEECQFNSEFKEALQRVRDCPYPFYSENQWEVVEALVSVLPLLVAELTVIFQKTGEVDFPEVSMRARHALGGSEAPSDLALGLDYRIRHILVDEFQDISIPQFRLLEQLTLGWQQNDGRTLFLVGDPMQSIYRFRQAEVGLFLKVKESGIGDLFLTSLTLTRNFRSDPKLVSWVNQTFQSIFPKEEDITLGAIAFHPSYGARKERDDVKMSIEKVEDGLQEAKQVVQFIQEARQEHPEESIAILVRSRSHLKEILSELHENDIPFQGVDLEKLIDEPIIQDLMSLMKALLHLGDRIAWLSVLRGPCCGLNLSDLWVLSHYEADLPLWWSLERYQEIGGLSVEGRDILSSFVPKMLAVLNEQGRDSLGVWLKKAWVSLGGFNYYPDLNSFETASFFFKKLEEEALKYNFFEVGILEERFEAIYSKPNMNNEKGHEMRAGSVQIMTIHKAKGLEFDTVLVPGLGRKLLNDPEKLLLWSERASRRGEPYLILAPIKSVGEEDIIYDFLKKQNQKAAHLEASRLLYVAATRAKRRLHLFTKEDDLLPGLLR